MNKFRSKKNITENTKLEVVEISEYGELVAVAAEGMRGRQKKIYVLENPRIKPALEVGDVFVGKISLRKNVCYVMPMSRIKMSNPQVDKLYGVVEKRGSKLFIVTSEKTNHTDYLLDKPGKIKAGDFVSFYLAGERKYKEVSIIKNFGEFDLGKAASLLVLEKYDIANEFSEGVGRELKKLPNFSDEKRENLTNIAFVTIDGEDSKDFDDAVWAEKIDGGFRLAVAIADVAFYVRPGSELDRDAYKRGNSVYLPNLVVPMLPEKLSNDLCSLRPKEKRPAIVCLMEINDQGKIKKYDFKRAVIKSLARLTYKEVQNAIDGEKNESTAPVFKSTIKPLYEAFEVLNKARKKRGALELETDELKIKFDKAGRVIGVEKQILYTSHKVIEEFMIAANVSAALALGKSGMPVMYRVHDKPRQEKMDDVKSLLEGLKIKLPEAPALRPEHFNKIIEKCREENLSAGISEMILRLQSQAQYSPQNIGHFGLGLDDYVHFTSPIRRYSDLLIHRAIISKYNLAGGGGMAEGSTEKLFGDIGEHLGETERKAVSAEREMKARFLSEYLSPTIGQEYEVKVSGMSKAGVFVRIDSIGAEGLMPMKKLPSDQYDLAESKMQLKGRYSKLEFNLGDVVNVRLEEASPITGGLIFSYADGGTKPLNIKKKNVSSKKRYGSRGKKCKKS